MSNQKDSKMAEKVKPIAGTNNRVLVEPYPSEEETAGGIVIPETAKEKPQRGKVIAVSDDLQDTPASVKEGNEVLYGKFAGTEFSFEGKDYLIMRESDIYATLN